MRTFQTALGNLEKDLKRLVFWCDIDVFEMHRRAREQQREEETNEVSKRLMQQKIDEYNAKQKAFN